MRITPGNRGWRPDHETLLLVGAGERVRRGPALRSLAGSFNVLLIDEMPLTWQCEGMVAGCAIDALTSDNLRLAVAALTASGLIDGLLTYCDYAVVETAQLAAELGVPHATTDSLAAARDKHLTRRALAGAAVPGPESRTADSEAQAALAADVLGYPVIVKPRRLGNSAGVVHVRTRAELRRAYAEAAGATAFGYAGPGGVLVEQLLSGPEVSVETITHAGRTAVVAVTHKETGFAPYSLEISHVVTAGDPLAAGDSPVAQVAVAAVEALGIDRGACHVEVMVTSEGPRVIEVNPRLGGDLIPQLVQLATGHDLYLMAGQVAVGIAPTMHSAPRRGSAGIRFVHSPRSGRFAGMCDERLATQPWVRQISMLADYGARVTAFPDGPPSRVALAIVEGADSVETAHRLDLVEAALTVSVT